MKLARKLSAASLVLCLASIAACNGGLADELDFQGTMAFGFTGTSTGTFSAAGTYHASDPSRFGKEFAAAAREPNATHPYVSVVAIKPTGGNLADGTALLLPNVTAPGSFQFTASCSPSTAVGTCAVGIYDRAGTFIPGTPTPNEEIYTFTSGTLEITSVDGARIVGTFTGTATVLGSNPAKTLTVTGGHFDVPLVSASSNPGGTPLPL
ncbi:MAG TPA: hypothetical protein VFE05_01950 [Longimicrobiaceae bacterium]|jgi:hypothetical protein|nr:hypothetical protein [Longimicrobiaceae bacterium]